MKSSKLNRREIISSGVLAAAGATLLPGCKSLSSMTSSADKGDGFKIGICD